MRRYTFRQRWQSQYTSPVGISTFDVTVDAEGAAAARVKAALIFEKECPGTWPIGERPPFAELVAVQEVSA